jgi:hypothetical protein
MESIHAMENGELQTKTRTAHDGVHYAARI